MFYPVNPVTKKIPMARTTTRTRRRATPRLRVNAAEANRVRQLLLSEDVQMLHKRDIHTLLKILDDVYPARYASRQRRKSAWRPLLIGIGIGLLLILGIMVL
jgi:hypothetical protein